MNSFGDFRSAACEFRTCGRRSFLGLGLAALVGCPAHSVSARLPAPDEVESPMVSPVSQWSHQFIGSIHDYLYLIYIGASPLPPNSLIVAGLDDPRARAMFRPGEYADLGDLANLFTVGGGLGTLGGGYLRGVRGLAVGGFYGISAGLRFWLGWQLGTAIYRVAAGGWIHFIPHRQT